MTTSSGDVTPRLVAALADRYRIERELGAGGMAVVYLARDLKHDRNVAIKVLRPEQTASMAASRFLREIRFEARLTHPNVVTLHDSGEVDGLLYYVMPHVEGESLRQRLEREHQLPVEDALGITREVADGLAYAHGCGVIHRDIKPENILLAHGHALLTDFGIAKAAADAGTGSLTSSGTFVGTPLYASPEQATESQQIDARADLYSLACVLYEMLSGEPPFTGPTQQAVLAKHALEARPSVRTVRETVPPHVDDALRRAMARVPADRFPSVAAFASALDRASHDEAAYRKRGPGRRRLVHAAGVVLGVVAFGSVVLWGWRHLRETLAEPRAIAYAESPGWSGWTQVSGEYIPFVAATDTALLVRGYGIDTLYAYRGRRWAALAIPPPFRLLNVKGSTRVKRLLAARSDGQDGVGSAYSWLSVGPDRLLEAQRLPSFGPDPSVPYWWTDGLETAAWTYELKLLEGDHWTRENPGIKGTIQTLWGLDLRHRFALSSETPDSLLVYDGISWRVLDIFPGPVGLRPTYRAGTTLRDGTTVVVGQACDSGSCEPLILQQDTFGGRWHRVAIPAGLGIPRRQDLKLRPDCGGGHMGFTGVGGEGRHDYYVWGDWSHCEHVPARRTFYGCPPDWPCTWHVTKGGLKPVAELRGRVLTAVLRAGSDLFAVGEDGTLWLRTQAAWRQLDQVPGFPDLTVASSGTVLVRLQGEHLTYEPGGTDTISPPTVAPLWPSGVLPEPGLRALAVRDSMIALVGGNGSVYRSACGMSYSSSRIGDRSLVCETPVRLAGPGGITGIGILPDGGVIGVGPGEVTRWHAGRTVREDIPASAATDTFWAVSVAADGTAVVVGQRTLLQRAAAGTWTVLREFPAGTRKGSDFAVVPNGYVTLADGWLRLWPRAAADPRDVALNQPAAGRARPLVVHAFADGRLVAGFGNPDATGVGGWIEVWAAPVRRGVSDTVQLPLNVDVTSLADDGFSLFIAGKGGTMAIPLASLPFSPRQD